MCVAVINTVADNRQAKASRTKVLRGALLLYEWYVGDLSQPDTLVHMPCALCAACRHAEEQLTPPSQQGWVLDCGSTSSCCFGVAQLLDGVPRDSCMGLWGVAQLFLGSCCSVYSSKEGWGTSSNQGDTTSLSASA